MLEFLISNWPFIILALAILIVAIVWVIKFIKQPTSAQLDTVREWLLYAVTQAEREFGAGTGKLKLSFVYDGFISRFPALAAVISPELFNTLVDEVLIKFRSLLETNTKIKEYIESSEQ